MIKKAANFGAEWLCNSGIIERQQVNIYTYGIELLLSGVVNIIIVLAVSASLFYPAAGILFFLAFIPLRLTAGGYHATSHLKCNLSVLIAFIVLESSTHLLLERSLALLCLAVGVFSFATLLFLSPCEAVNKPLTAEHHIRNRRRSLLIGGFNVVLALILFANTNSVHQWAIDYFLGVFAASISMWAAQIIYGRR